VSTVQEDDAWTRNMSEAEALHRSLLFIGFPGGAEIIHLTAATLMAVALLSYGVEPMETGSPLPGT
jgi:hypothetical protein